MKKREGKKKNLEFPYQVFAHSHHTTATQKRTQNRKSEKLLEENKKKKIENQKGSLQDKERIHVEPKKFFEQLFFFQTSLFRPPKVNSTQIFFRFSEKKENWPNLSPRKFFETSLPSSVSLCDKVEFWSKLESSERLLWSRTTAPRSENGEEAWFEGTMTSCSVCSSPSHFIFSPLGYSSSEIQSIVRSISCDRWDEDTKNLKILPWTTKIERKQTETIFIWELDWEGLKIDEVSRKIGWSLFCAVVIFDTSPLRRERRERKREKRKGRKKREEQEKI